MSYELMAQPIIFGGYAPDKLGGSLGDYSPDLKNIRFNLDGGIETAKGYAKFNPYQITDGTVTEMFNIQSGYENYLLYNVRKTTQALSGLTSAFYYINNAGTVVALCANGTDYYGNIDCSVLNGIAYITGNNATWYWTLGVNEKMYAVPLGCPAGIATETHFSRVFVLAGSRVDYSNIYDPLTFTTATDFFYINKDDGDSGRGLKSFMGDLYVFKKFSCYKVVGTDFDATTGNYSVVRLIQVPGCLSGKSIVIANGKMYWISPEGAIEFDGSSVPRRIGKGIIDNTLLGQLTDYTPKSRDPYPQPWIGVHNKATNEIWWSANDTRRNNGNQSGTTVGTIYSYNYIMDKWSIISPSGTSYPASFATYSSIVTLKETVLMGGLISGYIHEWNNTAVSADGAAIDSYYCTDYIDLHKPYTRKNNYKLVMDAIRNAAGQLSCSHYYDNDPVATDMNTIDLSDGEYTQFREAFLDSLTSRTIKLKLAVNTAGRWFKINKAALQCYYDNGAI